MNLVASFALYLYFPFLYILHKEKFLATWASKFLHFIYTFLLSPTVGWVNDNFLLRVRPLVSSSDICLSICVYPRFRDKQVNEGEECIIWLAPYEPPPVGNFIFLPKTSTISGGNPSNKRHRYHCALFYTPGESQRLLLV